MKHLLAVLFALVGIGSAHAVYPERPITIVVPFAAGGPTDKTARDLTVALRKALPGSTFIIDNKGGVGGTLGATQVARASSDGYTLLLHHIGMATAPALYRNRLPYNTLEAFEFLGMVQEVPMTLLGRKTLPAKNYGELVAWINAQKGAASLANSGIGSASHLCGLMLMSTAKLEMLTVPYSGTAPAMNNLLGGQVDVMCDQSTNTTGQIKAGSVHAYAVTTSKRLAAPGLRDVPTLQEAGLRGFNVTSWVGLYAPKGTPSLFTKRLNEALLVALKDPEFIARQEAVGATVISDTRVTPSGHKRFVAEEMERWSVIIRSAGQYAD